ncbi:ATPase H+ transporting accessory protein 1 like a [Nelusetta ayraudi]|uniref:ATPase H+ transporting accessory protein 1 like a n=1 Tax=Nelusetta ayraudi TaxID=303726 RepID=UPI003F7254F9
MASPWKHCCILLFVVAIHLQSCSCQYQRSADSSAVVSVHEASRRRLLQAPGAALPFPPLQVLSDGKPCILFQARKLSLRYERQKHLDLTERTFSPLKSVDTSQSVCREDKAMLVMRYGDVEDLRSLSIIVQMSNTFYESSDQWWFSMESVSLLYNKSEEAAFNASEVYAPASSSYHCLHVSNLQHYSTLLLPSNEQARRWSITFTNFHIQAFNITAGKFSPASDCATFLTPAILMGLITSLILLLVLAYALHMVIHLKHIEHDDDHKADIYYPENAEQTEQCCVEDVEKNIL